MNTSINNHWKNWQFFVVGKPLILVCKKCGDYYKLFRSEETEAFREICWKCEIGNK